MTTGKISPADLEVFRLQIEGIAERMHDALVRAAFSAIAREGMDCAAALFLADGRNNQLLTLERDSGKVVGSLGRPGRYAGEFHWVHDMAIDSHGNLYAGEVDTGKRVQKFVRE